MALACGRDGFTLLEAWHAPDAPTWLRELPALQVLRTVWLQNYHRTVTEAGPEVTRRESGDLPPSRLRLASPHGTDARYGLKQGSWWTGYKVHISETCDETDEQDAATGRGAVPGSDGSPPRIITNIATTDATVTDAEMTEPIHRMLAARNLLPAEHCLDSGYPSAELIVGVKKRFGVVLITPVLLNSSPQARRHRIRPHRLHHRLGQAAGHLPSREHQHLVEPRQPARYQGDRGEVQQGDLPPMPGP